MAAGLGREARYSAKDLQVKDTSYMDMQVILEAQYNSVKAINPSAFSENVQLHPVTAKYGVLTASLLILNSDFQAIIFWFTSPQHECD